MYLAFVHEVSERLYVDDLITTVNSKEDVIYLCNRLTDIFAECSMTPHKWCANISKFSNSREMTTVLGVKWNLCKD